VNNPAPPSGSVLAVSAAIFAAGDAVAWDNAAEAIIEID
jgi:hypothetical protein